MSCLEVELHPQSFFKEPTATVACEWSDCRAAFLSQNDLVSHVNATHLKTDTSSQSSPCSSSAASSVSGSATPLLPDPEATFVNDICGIQSQRSSYDSSESRLQDDQYFQQSPSISALETGMPLLNFPPHSAANRSSCAFPYRPRARHTHHHHSVSISAGRRIVPCEWESCSQSFETSAALMKHLIQDHIGTGKSEYFCKWKGCSRAEEGRSFVQKQKVIRHLQIHAGPSNFPLI